MCVYEHAAPYLEGLEMPKPELVAINRAQRRVIIGRVVCTEIQFSPPCMASLRNHSNPPVTKHNAYYLRYGVSVTNGALLMEHSAEQLCEANE